jgi:hypothetical protein
VSTCSSTWQFSGSLPNARRSSRLRSASIACCSGSDVVFVEGHAGDSYLDGASDLELYGEVFDDVLASALSPSASAEMITRYRTDFAALSGTAPPRAVD